MNVFEPWNKTKIEKAQHRHFTATILRFLHILSLAFLPLICVVERVFFFQPLMLCLGYFNFLADTK